MGFRGSDLLTMYGPLMPHTAENEVCLFITRATRSDPITLLHNFERNCSFQSARVCS